MRISLRPSLERFVQQRVKSGEYDSADDLINDALMQLRDLHLPDAEKLEALRQELAPALASLDRGEGRPLNINQIKRAGRSILAARRRRDR